MQITIIFVSATTTTTAATTTTATTTSTTTTTTTTATTATTTATTTSTTTTTATTTTVTNTTTIAAATTSTSYSLVRYIGFIPFPPVGVLRREIPGLDISENSCAAAYSISGLLHSHQRASTCLRPYGDFV